jgi:Uma2 family endonuclease
MATGELTPQDVVVRPPPPSPPQNLPETDEQPLESPWHRACMNLLIESAEVHFAGRKDFYVGGNMFIYYSAAQARNRDYSGPDFFFVQGEGIDHDRPRLYWAVWDENGRYPNVIIELSSPSTAEEDHTTRKVLYERTFQTAEYFIYDPTTQVLEGWRLARRRYRRIKPNETGHLWCAELGFWVGTWRGEFQGHEDLWLRFFDSEGNVVPTGGELYTRQAEEHRRAAETARAEVERLRRELAAQAKQTPE